MKVCYAQQMREADSIAIKKFNIPGIVLMENAALSCVSEIKNFNSFTILVGKGNNGGDGLCIARHLLNMGKNVNIYLIFGDEFKGDALINYKILKSVGADFKTLENFNELKTDILLSDCVVDAIFGIGISGEIKSPVKEIIEAVNNFGKYVFSVDVPSGINSDNGEIFSVAVKADKTVTFAAYKTGLLLFPAADFAGEVICADISIPDAVLEDIKMQTVDDMFVKSIMPKRFKNSHKGSYGKVFAIGGSVGMDGAVVLAAKAAFKVGAGIVTACVPENINSDVTTACVQAMTFPVDFSKNSDKILDKISEFDAVLFGNGIGRDVHVTDLLKKVLKTSKVPVIIDADGLYALSKDPEMLKRCVCDVILTPHSQEMARLIGKSADYVEKNRLLVSKDFAQKYGVTLVLKGNHSIITAPDGNQYINMTGNSGMATAGSGDVLAGMAAGFACVCEATEAAVLSVYLHGAAGDFAAENLTEYALTAPDILDAVPHILPVEKE